MSIENSLMMSSRAYQPGLHRFAAFTAWCTLLLLVAGALVTSNQAGLAVPDWPLSYGSLMPPMVGGIFWEHGHRLVATSVGFLTIILAVWLARREPRRWVRRLGWAALALVIAQGLLGGLTVKLLLPKAVSIAHATLAQLFFCTVVSLAAFTSRWWQSDVAQLEQSETAPLRNLAAVTCGAILAQLILGAAFRHRAIGILPHLLGAAVAATLIYRTAAVARETYAQVEGLRRLSSWLSGLVTLQLVLGGAALWARLAARPEASSQPLPLTVGLTVAHVAVGGLLFGVAVIVTLCTFRIMKPHADLAMASRAGRAAA